MGVRLKNRDQSPVNGFWVNVPQTGFNQQFWRFTDAVKALWDHLQGNPGITTRFKDLPTSMEACAEYVDRTNAARMLTIKGAASYIISDDSNVPVPKSVPPQPRGFGAVVGGARKVAVGLTTLLMWLGKGGTPVPAPLAQKRATSCANRAGADGKPVRCPQNIDADLTSIFTVPVADRLRKQLQMRKDLNLSTPYDESLGICQACACPLKLKVHVPLDEIVAHMPDFVRADLDPLCWILAEEKK